MEETDPPEGQFLRDLYDGWSEYITPAGRRVYYNAEMRKTSWKPPRRMVNGKEDTMRGKPSLRSFSENEDNVGSILKEGNLQVTKLWQDNQQFKKKWKKCICFLTDSHFVFQKHRGTGEPMGRISLEMSTVKKEQVLTNRENAYCLAGPTTAILFHCKNALDAETWCHALEFVIAGWTRNHSIRQRYSIGSLNFSSGKNPSFRWSSLNYDETLPRNSLRRLSEVPDVVDGTIRAPRNSLRLLDENVRNLVTLRRPKTLLPAHMKFPTPSGWIAKFDVALQSYVYEYTATGEVWGAAVRSNGGIYFYDTNSSRTSFLLPTRRNIETDV